MKSPGCIRSRSSSLYMYKRLANIYTRKTIYESSSAYIEHAIGLPPSLFIPLATRAVQWGIAGDQILITRVPGGAKPDQKNFGATIMPP